MQKYLCPHKQTRYKFDKNVSQVFKFFLVLIQCPLFSEDTQGWGVSPRGAGYLFGSDVVTQVYCKQKTIFCIIVLIVTNSNHAVL